MFSKIICENNQVIQSLHSKISQYEMYMDNCNIDKYINTNCNSRYKLSSTSNINYPQPQHRRAT